MVKLSVAPAKKTAIVLKPKPNANSSAVITTAKISLVPAGAKLPTNRSQPIVNLPHKQHERGQSIVRAATGFRVRVSNIAYDVKEADILASFSVIGKVLGCTLRDGTAIVTYDKRQDATTAIDKFHQGDIRGRKIYLDFD